jgi:flagella basal body P-ring formation protein FlgA
VLHKRFNPLPRVPFRLIGTLVALLAAAFDAMAADDPPSLQTLDSIRDAAADFVYANSDQFAVTPEVSPGRLDSRLQLSRCELPLQSFSAPGGLRPGNAVVGVRCDGDKPWKLFVPVEIKLPGTVVVAARALQRGQVIGRYDLELQLVDLAEQHRGYFQSPAQVIGQKLKRSLSPSTVVSPRMLTRKKLVRRGGKVIILAGDSQFSVRMKGKALSDGGRGDRIEVRNLSSGRNVSATVIKPGLVKVTY